MQSSKEDCEKQRNKRSNRGIRPHRPYQGMRPEQSEGVKPLGQSGETQDSMYRTARVNRVW